METKKCCTCKEIKPISEFYKKKQSKDGLDARCKKCNYTSSRIWLKTPRGKLLMKKLHRNIRIKMRTEIFKRLGGKCVKCGYSDIRALHIDHINGGGRKERNAKGYSQHRFYLNLSKGIGIEKFQLLCANCNWIKLCESREN